MAGDAVRIAPVSTGFPANREYYRDFAILEVWIGGFQLQKCPRFRRFSQDSLRRVTGKIIRGTGTVGFTSENILRGIWEERKPKGEVATAIFGCKTTICHFAAAPNLNPHPFCKALRSRSAAGRRKFPALLEAGDFPRGREDLARSSLQVMR